MQRNEMTEQEKLARQWAEEYQNDWPKFTPGTRAAELVEKAKAAAECILATTTPPTMADTEWDDEEHYLAGATCEIARSERVMLAPKNGRIMNAPLEGDRVSLTSPGALTPNGKRYKLVEVPDHPEVLETEEDYENALEGTVAAVGYSIWVKNSYGAWSAGNGAYNNGAMAKYECTVLRWGWGE